MSPNYKQSNSINQLRTKKREWIIYYTCGILIMFVCLRFHLKIIVIVLMICKLKSETIEYAVKCAALLLTAHAF